MKGAQMKIKSISVIILLLLFSHLSLADQISHRNAVEKLFILTKTSKMMDSVKIQTQKILYQQLRQQDIPEAKKPIYNKYMSKMIELITNTVNWDKIKSQMTDLYVSNFSENEINDMLTFYRSPTGKKFVEKMPVIVQKSMEIGQKQSRTMIPKLNMLLEQMKKELGR
jgi:hypothetical protein